MLIPVIPAELSMVSPELKKSELDHEVQLEAVDVVGAGGEPRIQGLCDEELGFHGQVILGICEASWGSLAETRGGCCFDVQRDSG